MIELQIQYRALTIAQAADSHQGATSIQIIAVAHPSNQTIDSQKRKSFRLMKGDAGSFLLDCSSLDIRGQPVAGRSDQGLVRPRQQFGISRRGTQAGRLHLPPPRSSWVFPAAGFADGLPAPFWWASPDSRNCLGVIPVHRLKACVRELN